jgi:cbb3-type cytochrome oxidase cytochrome c subunit
MRLDDPSVLQSNMQTYQLLVQELLKSEPEEKKIKRLMHDLGLPYTAEHIDRLSTVLAFNPLTKKDANDL